MKRQNTLVCYGLRNDIISKTFEKDMLWMLSLCYLIVGTNPHVTVTRGDSVVTPVGGI